MAVISGQTPGKATAVNNVATLNTDSGLITSDSITTGQGSKYTLTLNYNQVTPNSVVQVSVGNGTNTGGTPVVSSVTCAQGVVTIVILNSTGVGAFNGTLLIAFIVFN